ncbi:scopoletin 8-hydroxylase-like [Coffea arabica]|uniref:feruloyl-CoA 6-hydroxylase n=1 Tax=Coffea arabica TaxID=13443 RepID=A0A6P6TBZ2_COFAR|nr:feruloyl CoA ortho-hydroxylase 1-like [Coffea arabica]
MAPTFDDGNSLFDFVVKDGNGVKGLVDSGITKVPERFIQPPSERIEKVVQSSKDHFASVPIDLSKLDGPDHDQVVEAIVRAAETLGFFQVINHGVSFDLLESLKNAAQRFFAQPADAKAVYLKRVSPSPFVKYGTSFAPEQEKALEWKDFVSMVYTNDGDAQQHWPKVCKEEALEYLKLSSKMVRRLLEILIGNLGVTLDDSRLESLIGNKIVNMNFYPICPNPELTVGVGRHSDMSILTVLLQDNVGGLYVKLEEEILDGRKEEWMEIPPIPGALVINAGDSLQILSNGRYKSAEHGVRTTSKKSRISIPVFNLPRPTEKIGPLPHVAEVDGGAVYREVMFQEYMSNHVGHAHEGKKSLDFVKVKAN